LEDEEIKNTPVLRLYKKGEDRKKYVEIYGKDKTVEDLKKFLEENSEVYREWRKENPEKVVEEEVK
jgi:hypothetical protein